MPVPNSFANVTTSIPLSQLDANFNTPITLGNTAIQLGNTVTTLNNMTLANVTVSSGNVTITNVSVTTANVTTANIGTSIITTSETLNYGTANQVQFLNASKVLTGSANLTFDGTTLTPHTLTVSTGVLTVPAGSNTAPSITTSGDTNTGVFFPAADTVAIGTGGTERLRVASAGNVGIGETSPTEKLVLTNSSGNAKLLTNSGANSVYMGWDGTDAIAEVATGGAWRVRTGGSYTERMRLDTSGNLGVNLTPSAGQGRFQLNGAGQTWFKFYDSTAGSNYGTFYKANGTTGLGYIGSGGGNAISGGTVDDLAIRSEASIYFAAGGNNVRGLIASTGRVDLAESTTNGVYIRSQSFITLANNATLNITASTCGSALINVYQREDGNGGTFFATFSTVVTKIAGDGSATDAGATFAVYKASPSHTTTIRNRYGASKTFSISVYSADAQP